MNPGESSALDQGPNPPLNLRQNLFCGGKAPLPVFHLPAQVWPHIKPEALVRCVQIVELIREPANRILVYADLLAWLQHAEQQVFRIDAAHSLIGRGRSATEKNRPCQPPTSLDASKAWIVGFNLYCL